MKPITSEILDRSPPHDLEAEMCVLGSLLILPKLFDTVAAMLRPADFYSDANARIFAQALAIHEEGKRLDTLLLRNRLKQAGDFELIGGDAYLTEVVRAVPTATNCEHYARIAQDKARLRAVIQACKVSLQDAYDADADPQAVSGRAELAFAQLAASGQRVEPVGMPSVVARALERARTLTACGKSLGLATGLRDFDEVNGGLHNGELVLLAARPGVGKTALALQIATHAAQRGRHALVVSLEMSDVELVSRALCGQAAVDSRRLRTGQLTERDLNLLDTAGELLACSALHILDAPAVTMTDIRAAAKGMHHRQGLSLLVLDYLQRVTPEDRRLPRYQQLGIISGQLKQLARELDIPLLVLAQLNREVESATDHRPRLSHLRESGDLEADADVVALLHRPEMYSRDPDDHGRAELIIAKNRNGPSDSVFKLRWEAHSTTFTREGDLTPTDWEQAIANDPWDEPPKYAVWEGAR